MTLSAPGGSMAPVMIRAHSPLPTTRPVAAPAAMVSVMRYRVPVPPAGSAKPSIADLSKGGESMGDRTVSARTLPSASSIGIVSAFDPAGMSRRMASASSSSITGCLSKKPDSGRLEGYHAITACFHAELPGRSRRHERLQGDSAVHGDAQKMVHRLDLRHLPGKLVARAGSKGLPGK